MSYWRAPVAFLLAAIALPAAAGRYLILRADETARNYTLPVPLNSARLTSADGSLSVWLDEQPLLLDHKWLRSFKGASLDTAVLARDPANTAEPYVLIDCISGRLV